MRGVHIDGIRPEQLMQIRAEARRLRRWYRSHPALHNLINISVLLFLLLADFLALIVLPAKISTLDGSSLAASICVVGFLHGFIAYSLANLLIHEGPGHETLIQVTGPVTAKLASIMNQLCRFLFIDPEYFGPLHKDHHRFVGTERDGSYSHFVRPQQLIASLLPMAIFLNFNRYKVHSGTRYTPSRLLTETLSVLYILVYLVPMTMSFGPVLGVMTLIVIGPTVAFGLDRLRESIEHNLMPEDSINGARDMGLTVPALILSGGPWGQMCHLSHHLAPHLTWYQQLALHRALRRILDASQRRSFIVSESRSGLLGLFCRLAADTLRIESAMRRQAPSRS